MALHRYVLVKIAEKRRKKYMKMKMKEADLENRAI